MTTSNVPSLKSRYIYKLLTNFTSIPFYLLMEAILPRALGPQMYGNFYYITDFFGYLIDFMCNGTSSCFFVSLARRPKNYSLVAFYAYVSLAIFVLACLASLTIMLPSIGNVLMPDVPLWLVPLGAFWAYSSWWNKLLLSVNDAIGLTIQSEIIRSIFYIIGVLILISMYFANALNIKSLFIQQFSVIFTMSMAYYWVMRKYWINFSFKLKPRQIKTFFWHFYHFSHPLFIHALLASTILIFERWLLQYFAGSAEQGYFNLAYKVGVACLIFNLALAPLLTRELAIAWSKRNLLLVKQLIEKYMPMLCFIVGYFSCFVIIENERIAHLFGGPEFASAASPIHFIGLYPIFMTYTYVVNAFFLASGNTRLFRNITILEFIITMPLLFFLLAPKEYFGLNLGASGLALKLSIMQFFVANLAFWVISRMTQVDYKKVLIHQIATITVLLLSAFTCYSLTVYFLQINSYLRFLISGFLYSCLVFFLLILFPKLAGLSRESLNGHLDKLFIILKIRKVT